MADERARSADKERGLREQAEGNAKRARQRLWFAFAASVLLLFVAGYAFREAQLADEQSAIADNQTTEANRQKAIAEAQTVEANKQKTLAQEQTAAANEQRAIAEKQRAAADEQKALAEKQTAAAINNETHALAALSGTAAREGRALDGVELALAAWPRTRFAERPMLGDAIRYLSLAFSEHPPVAVLNHQPRSTARSIRRTASASCRGLKTRR